MKKENNSIQVYSDMDILANIKLSDAQKDVAQQTAGKMAAIDMKLNAIDNELRIVKTKIAQSEEAIMLKKLKASRKELKAAHTNIVASMNGIMKMALSEVPGNSLAEKYKHLGFGG